MRRQRSAAEHLLRRSGGTVAYVIAPAQYKRSIELEVAARRAIWNFSIQRGLISLQQGRVIEWDTAASSRLRVMFPEP